MLNKLLEALLSKPLSKVNEFVSGKKTYIAGAILILQALACLAAEVSKGLDANSLLALLHSDCVKQLGEGLAIIGFRHTISKN